MVTTKKRSSTMTATVTADDLPAKDPGIAARVRKGRLAATWHTRDPSEWTWAETVLVYMNILQDPVDSPRPPVHAKTAPVPVLPVWRQHVYAIPRALLPLLLHAGFTAASGTQLSAWVAGPLYFLYFVGFGFQLFSQFKAQTKHYGYFDGTVERDGIPDVDTTAVAFELGNVPLLRTLLGFIFIYDPTAPLLPPTSLLMLPFNLFMYSCILDFYFYWYHRLMHEVDFLWRFHRKHHTTKHPNAALGAYADHEQELFDMFVIPLLTYLTWRVDFPTWWFAQIYMLYIEAGGHSGMRVYIQNPLTWFLRYFDCELCLEDHDIHHRRGWKKSGNYGKQTRLWDTIFGTKKDRVECLPEQLDWSHKGIPL